MERIILTELLSVCVVVLYHSEACTLQSIKSLQDPAIAPEKLDGHWFVTLLHGDTSSYTSYTMDVVPTLQGITIYTSRNTSDDCKYEAAELNSTGDPLHFVHAHSGFGQAFVVKASSDFALVYYCDDDVAAPDDCVNPRAWVLGRQPDSAGALRWLQAVVHDNPPCFDSAAVEVAQESVECPFRPIWGLPGHDCRVNTFPVQQNFDINRYIGVWYEMSWLAPVYMPTHMLLRDYSHTYIMNADGNFTGHVAGRSPDDGVCSFYNISYTRTDAPGKMYFLEGPDSAHISKTDYIVAATDYDHYAIVYGCRNVSQSTGECLQARSWLWSRAVTLHRRYLLEAHSMLQRLCFNPADFLATAQTNDCRRESQTTASSLGTGVPCTQGVDACAELAESITAGTTTYCCNRHQAISYHGGGGSHACTCTSL